MAAVAFRWTRSGAGSAGLLRSLVQTLSRLSVLWAAPTGTLYCSFCWISICLLRQEAFFFLSPPFSLDSSRDSSVVLLVFFYLELFWLGFFVCFFSLHSREPAGAEPDGPGPGRDQASKRKDTKTPPASPAVRRRLTSDRFPSILPQRAAV